MAPAPRGVHRTWNDRRWRRSVSGRIKQRLDARLFRRLLATLPGTQLSALDVGGGAGSQLTVLRTAEPRMARTVVVDIDAGAEAIARENGHEYVAGQIEDFETDTRFDLVLLLNLIEHVAAPLAVLQKIHTLLTPHGILLVKTPNYASLDGHLFRRANWGGYHCPRHWVLFTRESFEALVSRAGLAVSGFTYTSRGSWLSR